MKNFEIGKEIHRILTEANITGVGNKVFPLIANVNTTFPFIVYKRYNYRPTANKDLDSEVVSMEIVAAATKYDDSVAIANSVADALNSKETQLIDDIQMTNVSEDFIDDAFVQQMTFDIYIK